MKIYRILILAIFTISCGVKSDGGLVDGIADDQHRVFVSSIDYDGNLGGLSGADSICNSLAQSAGLSKTYKAVLSDGATDSKDRIVIFGEVVKVGSSGAVTVLAASSTHFWGTDTTALNANIDLDEYGAARPNQTPWTGTGATGVGSLGYCNDWASNSSSHQGDFGSTNHTGPQWTENNFEDCNLTNPIFCISIN